MEIWMQQLLQWLALPQYGLSTVFVVSLVSATLLPLGSEPAVFGLVKLNPQLFWPAVLVATIGNTVGGAISWWTGLGARKAWNVARRNGSGSMPQPQSTLTQRHVRGWLRRWGAKTCLFSWLPVVGDPLCAVAGWLQLPFWPCVLYMAIGKLLRYVIMTTALLYLLPGQWLM